MSDCKCEHNNHSHFLIWMFVWASLFFPSCVDCSGERAKTQRDISSLESDVRSIKSELGSEQVKSNQLRIDLNNERFQNEQLEEQIRNLRTRSSGMSDTTRGFK